MIYIKTADGYSGMANGKPFSVSMDHPNIEQIVEAIKNNNQTIIHDLINRSVQLKAAMTVTHPRVFIDDEAGVVLFDNVPIVDVLTNRVFEMIQDGFDVCPMVNFIDNLYQNPSKKTIDRIYDWLEAGRMPITEDGHFIAYKRVNYDYTSFYDNKTKHNLLTVVSMPRFACDDRHETVCSTGLHFCSQEYLSNYFSGQGRVLILKVNPADVVSIPIEYGTSKGRACKYFVLGELVDEHKDIVEHINVLTDPVYSNEAVVTDSAPGDDAAIQYRVGYENGYNFARGRSIDESARLDAEYLRGFEDGRKDGKGHKKRKSF